MTYAAIPTRRALVALAPAALVAVPALASGPPAEDAELLALAAEHAKADAALVAAYDYAAVCRDRTEYPAEPDVLTARRDDWFVPHSAALAGVRINGAAVESWRKALAEGSYASRMSEGAAARFRERGAEVVEAWDAHRMAMIAAEETSGFRQATDDADPLCEEAGRLEMMILKMRARTPAGWRAKARLVADDVMVHDPDGTLLDAALRGLLADLLGSA